MAEAFQILTRQPRNQVQMLIILDSFMGSGTTAVACMELGRKYIGFEINQTYFDVAQKRIQDCSGKIK